MFFELGRLITTIRTLSAYQVEGARWLAYQRRGILNDPLGLGKTAQAIHACDLAGHKRVLIIVPKSLIHNWSREIGMWSGGEIQEFGTRTKVFSKTARWYITNYEMAVLRDLKKLIPPWDCLIVDEATRIKSRKAKRTKTVWALGKPARHVYLLTGLLVHNSPSELWSLLHCVDSKSFRGYWKWIDEFCEQEPVYSGGRVVTQKVVGPKDIEVLRESIAPYVLRREKDLLGLPPITSERRLASFGLEQWRTYSQMKRVLVAEVEQKALIAKNALEGLVRLRLIANDPRLVGAKTGSPKTDLICELVSSAVEDGQSILVFSLFEKYASLLLKELEARKIRVLPYTGKEDLPERDEAIQKLNAGAVSALVGTYGAMGEGLNLQKATLIIEADLPWTPALVQQAEGRSHRRGQEHAVTVIRTLTDGSVDLYVEDVIQGKQKFLDALTALKVITEQYDEGGEPLGEV